MKNQEITELPQLMRAIFALILSAMGKKCKMNLHRIDKSQSNCNNVSSTSGMANTIMFATDVSKARAAGKRIYEVIDREPSINARSPKGKVLTLAKVQGELVIKNINFRYPMRPDVSVFKKGFSFSVAPGQTVALVGGSGCGKSTIIQLLERFYDVEESGMGSKESGLVTLDGFDIRDLNVKSLRSVLGLVSQEPVLFNTTIAENIRYGAPEATDEEVIQAAQMANAHNFIMEFPKQYETVVGKGGKFFKL